MPLRPAFPMQALRVNVVPNSSLIVAAAFANEILLTSISSLSRLMHLVHILRPQDGFEFGQFPVEMWVKQAQPRDFLHAVQDRGVIAAAEV